MNYIKKIIVKIFIFFIIKPFLYAKEYAQKNAFTFTSLTIIGVSLLLAILSYIFFWGETITNIFICLFSIQNLIFLSKFKPQRIKLVLLIIFELFSYSILLAALFEILMLNVNTHLGFMLFFILSVAVLNIQSITQKLMFKKIKSNRYKVLSIVIIHAPLLLLLVYKTMNWHIDYIDFIVDDPQFEVIREWITYFVIGIVLDTSLKAYLKFL